MHQHIKIYNTVPYNTGENKLDILVPFGDDPGMAMARVFDPNRRSNGVEDFNTITRFMHIPTGHVSNKMDDEPYIVPFIVENSDKCVIVCAGGAYVDVSLDNEGYPTCEFLKEHGITAFALKYRVWPYKYPCALLDLRRAICYVKYHAKEFGIDPNKVSILGFSAGGNLVGTKALAFNKLPQIDNYVPDEIDTIDDSVATVAPIYGELLGNEFLMSVQYGEEVLNNKEYSNRICEENYLPKYVTKNSTPMFLTACRDDSVVDPLNSLEMAIAYEKAKAQYELHLFTEGGHGFGTTQENVPPMYGHNGFNMEGTKHWIRLYIDWLNKVVK